MCKRNIISTVFSTHIPKSKFYNKGINVDYLRHKMLTLRLHTRMKISTFAEEMNILRFEFFFCNVRSLHTLGIKKKAFYCLHLILKAVYASRSRRKNTRVLILLVSSKHQVKQPLKTQNRRRPLTCVRF